MCTKRILCFIKLFSCAAAILYLASEHCITNSTVMLPADDQNTTISISSHKLKRCETWREKVTSPPKIVKQPTQEEILFQVAQPGEVDKPFIIECEAEGEPAPKYRWLKNGKPFNYTSYGNRISPQSGRGALVFSQPRDDDLGQYQCFAYNEWGTATSNSVFVRRAELNSFKETDTLEIWALEGSPFKFTCEPPDVHPKPKVYWMLQGNQGQLKTINNSRITPDPQGNLWFSYVNLNDASVDSAYICTANSIFTNEYIFGKQIHLKVMEMIIGPATEDNANDTQIPVRLYASSMTKYALIGKRVELYCIYGGRPLPQIVWKKNGRFIVSSHRITQVNYGKTLVIRYPTYEDQGMYTCVVSNGVGRAQSHSVRLIIRAAPFFTVEPEIQNIAEGESAEIKCEASGTPAPKIAWIHNGKPIEQAEPNPRRQMNTNTIVITNLVKNDSGNYGCNATNAYGYVYKDVYINCFPSDKKTRDAKLTTGTIIIISSMFGAVLIVLVVIAIRKRCWVGCNSLETPQLPANDLSNRFYANLLFRRECDLEIEEIENHRYEEIGLPYEETELPHEELPIYEEINPQLFK